MDYENEMNEKLKKLRTKKVVRILAFESSCDETSVAIVENGRKILSNVVASQIEIHKRYGGVVPEIASRNHILAINPCLEEALKKAQCELKDIDAIAVTQGAGLVGALLVGVTSAKALAYALRKPLIAVNHIKGHIAANFLEHKDLTPPFVCLIASGGHTAIVKVFDYNNFEMIGTTQDDAIGEAFDKVARIVGLGYPGGPKIDKMAKKGEPNIIFVKHDAFEKSFDVSYSGLKTAVINYVHQKEQKGEKIDVENICASFQKQAVDMLTQKVVRACKKYKLNTVVLAGGVAANGYLREEMTRLCNENGLDLKFPPLELCGDNAAMIGSLAFFNMMTDDAAKLDMSARPNIPLK